MTSTESGYIIAVEDKQCKDKEVAHLLIHPPMVLGLRLLVCGLVESAIRTPAVQVEGAWGMGHGKNPIRTRITFKELL